MAEIVVGVDTSAGSAAALRWAVREGEIRGHSVAAVRSIGAHGDAAEAAAGLGRFVTDTIGADTDVSERVLTGHPAAALIEAADHAELLVVGARGREGFVGLLLGSVSQQCLRHATTSVAIVRNLPAPTSEPRIVVGVDGSDCAATALAWAVEEGRRRHAVVEAVYAWHLPYVDSLFIPVTDPTTDGYDQIAVAELDRMVAKVDETGLETPVVKTLVRGHAATAILEAAMHADLVVVGSRGHGGFTGMVLGSVSQHVAQHASCPVVVVR